MTDLTVAEALKVLELEPGATHDQARTAFRRLARLVHPDVAGPQSQSAMQRLIVAREVLLAYPTGVDASAFDADRQARAHAAAEAAADEAWAGMAAAWDRVESTAWSSTVRPAPPPPQSSGPVPRAPVPSTSSSRNIPWGRVVVGGLAVLLLAAKGVSAYDGQTSTTGECWADRGNSQVVETSCSATDARWKTKSIVGSPESCIDWYVPLDNGRFACLTPLG